MPTYDYRCDNCGHELEVFQSMSASPLRKCPECGRLKLKRLIGTGAGVIFKGGGFWETDYRSDSYKKDAEAEKKPAESKSDKKTETKSEKKTEKKKTDTAKSAAKKSKPAKDSK
ncbi:zinc ribbon domain-containing protein [Planctomycetales bacterium ZRK34]|nr:zinc ribbon domain-containing protein [Planctomycetales bacterium ZRK34]